MDTENFQFHFLIWFFFCSFRTLSNVEHTRCSNFAIVTIVVLFHTRELVEKGRLKIDDMKETDDPKSRLSHKMYY